MAKFYKKSKLSKQEQEELLLDFCDAVSSIKNSEEAAKFLKDLLSPQEAEMLAKRIKIADLLLQDWKYKHIREALKVGENTIAKVSEWIKFTGDGYRLITRRLREKRKNRKIDNLDRKESLNPINSLKNRYPIMFWPEILIKEYVKNKKIKDRKKVIEALEVISDKPKLYRQIEREFRKSYGIE